MINGGNKDNVNFEPTSEVLDLDTLEWSQGPPAIPLISSTTVKYEETFLLVGGEANAFSGSIYEYDLVENDWIMRSEELAVGRARHVAFEIPSEVTER